MAAALFGDGDGPAFAANERGATTRWFVPAGAWIRIGGMRSSEPDNLTGPEVTLRIPGMWRQPEDFFDRLPRGCRATKEGIALADGSQFELHALAADEEFPRIFAGSCAKTPTAIEREQIENYTVNMCLTGRGGSLESARRLMEGAAAVLAAGGAGVFVDNSGIAHGASDWLTLLDSAAEGGLYWAFVSAVRTDVELYTIGMHVLGCRDAVAPLTGDDQRDFRTIHSFLGFSAFSGATLRDGDMVTDPALPSLRAFVQADDRTPAEAPMFNPYGRWRLVLFDAARN